MEIVMKFYIIGGSCAIEDENYITIAQGVKDGGGNYLRGGLFKPRSSPKRWHGIGIYGLEILKEAKRVTGLPVVSEAMNAHQIEILYDYVDMFQVGSRNMTASEFLKEIGKQDKPILLKRGFGSTIEEFVMAADFIMESGNTNVVLCERGIRTFETYTRNTFDINCIPAVKELTNLPIIADPSHGTGKASLVEAVSLAAVAAGANGLIIEVHNHPEKAMTDGMQSVTPDIFTNIVNKANKIRGLI